MSIVTIQQRGGLMENFDPQKMLPKEWAVSTDPETENQVVWMCFRPGVVKRMGTYEDFKQMVAEATDDIREQYEETFNEIKECMEGLESSAESSKIIAETKAGEAAESAEVASQGAAIATEKAEEITEYAGLSKSYAVGTNGEVREGDDSDCAGFYYDQCRELVQGLGGTIIPMGEITYQELKNVNPLPGYMYTVSNPFLTDDGFKEGSGILYPAGVNIYYTNDGYWSNIAGTTVSRITQGWEAGNGIGNVHISHYSIGALSFENENVNHNSLGRGKDLTNEYDVEEICYRISDLDFLDLFIGDGFNIEISTEYGEETVNCLLGGFNTFLLSGIETGNLLTRNHAVIIPAQCFNTLAKMNDSNTTAGGFVGSKMWEEVLPVYEEALRAVFGEHLLSHSAYLSTAIDSSLDSHVGLGYKGVVSDAEAHDVCLCLPSEVQIFGRNVFTSSFIEESEDDVQLPIFSLFPYLRVGLYAGGLTDYWLRNVGSNANFASVYVTGQPNMAGASELSGVRPIFCIG